MTTPASAPLQFPYVRFPVIDPLTKHRSAVYRPVIPLRLCSTHGSLRCQGLIDSGADECIFAGEFATSLGFELLKGTPRVFAGIGGSVIGYLHWTFLEVGPLRLRCPIYYSDEWSHLRFGLLGQVGFLSHVTVTLDYRTKRALLATHPSVSST